MKLLCHSFIIFLSRNPLRNMHATNKLAKSPKSYIDPSCIVLYYKFRENFVFVLNDGRIIRNKACASLPEILNTFTTVKGQFYFNQQSVKQIKISKYDCYIVTCENREILIDF